MRPLKYENGWSFEGKRSIQWSNLGQIRNSKFVGYLKHF